MDRRRADLAAARVPHTDEVWQYIEPFLPKRSRRFHLLPRRFEKVGLAGSSTKLNDAIAGDPIGALTSILPVWFLIPFAIVAVLGLIGGAVLDIYSSGIALLSSGLKIPRPVAAGIDGVIMIIGTVYIVFFATDFIGPFQGFLITLGTPIAAWCGIFLADLALRRGDYSDADLFNSGGRYGRANWLAIGALIIGTALGWGLITNPIADAHWLDWLGYLLEPFGLGGRGGEWAYANLGVLVALVVGFLAVILFGRSKIRRQEAASDAGPLPEASASAGGVPADRA